jgi:hypothetical protein
MSLTFKPKPSSDSWTPAEHFKKGIDPHLAHIHA